MAPVRVVAGQAVLGDLGFVEGLVFGADGVLVILKGFVALGLAVVRWGLVALGCCGARCRLFIIGLDLICLVQALGEALDGFGLIGCLN